MPSTALPASNVYPLEFECVCDWEAILSKHEKHEHRCHTVSFL